MTINSFEAFCLISIFILPGFIVNSIIDYTNPPKKYKEVVFILKSIGYSIINCAIWSWLYLFIIKYDGINNVFRFILLVCVSLISSTIIGLIIAKTKQRNVIDAFLAKLHIKTIHGTPTAWDYYFSKLKCDFVIITLIDDTQLFGWYSSESFTSSDPEERDIYVEKAYRFENEQWILDEEGNGFYVPKDQIKMIEFKKGVDDSAEKNL
ncbi:MAG: hypothetical protein IJI67_01685 [Clostridia bacterium]|nr:hypothetical protein [Clostridia bacterium]